MDALTLWLGVIMLPIIFALITWFFNVIFNVDTIEILVWVFDNIEIYLGSNVANIFSCLFLWILLFYIYRTLTYFIRS